MAMNKAKWVLDYDMHTDKCYKRPGCAICEVPVVKCEDGYRCFYCNEMVNVDDPEMIQWFDDREGEKVEYEDCPQFEINGCIYGCGGKKTVETHYYRNNVTLEWLVGWSQCSKCGKRLIV